MRERPIGMIRVSLEDPWPIHRLLRGLRIYATNPIFDGIVVPSRCKAILGWLLPLLATIETKNRAFAP